MNIGTDDEIASCWMESLQSGKHIVLFLHRRLLIFRVLYYFKSRGTVGGGQKAQLRERIAQLRQEVDGLAGHRRRHVSARDR